MHTKYTLFSVLIVCLALAGCQPQTGGPNLSPATPAPAEATGMVVDAIFATLNRPNRMETTSVVGAETSSNVIEFVPPDRKRIVDGEAEYVVVGDKVYYKDPTSGVWSQPVIPASALLGDPSVSKEEIASTLSNVRFLRLDTYEGRPVNVFGYQSASILAEGEARNQMELWVGVEDGLPYQIVAVGTVQAVSSDPATGAQTVGTAEAVSTIRIEFDPAITIEAPIP